jgi:hypothetical protein
MLIQKHHFVLIYSLNKISRWIKLNRDGKRNKILQNLLLKIINSMLYCAFCKLRPAAQFFFACRARLVAQPRSRVLRSAEAQHRLAARPTHSRVRSQKQPNNACFSPRAQALTWAWAGQATTGLFPPASPTKSTRRSGPSS